MRKSITLILLMVICSFTFAQKVKNGFLNLSDGSKYEGEYIKKKPNGKGKLLNPYGDFYEGDFVNGVYEGYGVFTFSDGEKYEGNWIGGQQHGKGTFYFKNGNKYVGEWYQDYMQGNAVMYYYNGDVFEGQWIKDHKGMGKYTFCSGGYIERDFSKDSSNGVIVFQDSSKYIGDIIDNMANGNGIYYFANGDKYEAKWHNGLNDGIGTYTFKNGGIEEVDLDQYFTEIGPKRLERLKLLEKQKLSENLPITFYAPIRDDYKKELLSMVQDFADILYGYGIRADDNPQINLYGSDNKDMLFLELKLDYNPQKDNYKSYVISNGGNMYIEDYNAVDLSCFVHMMSAVMHFLSNATYKTQNSIYMNKIAGVVSLARNHDYVSAQTGTLSIRQDFRNPILIKLYGSIGGKHFSRNLPYEETSQMLSLNSVMSNNADIDVRIKNFFTTPVSGETTKKDTTHPAMLPKYQHPSKGMPKVL